MLRWAEFYAPVSTALMIMIAGIHPTIFPALHCPKFPT